MLVFAIRTAVLLLGRTKIISADFAWFNFKLLWLAQLSTLAISCPVCRCSVVQQKSPKVSKRVLYLDLSQQALTQDVTPVVFIDSSAQSCS